MEPLDLDAAGPTRPKYQHLKSYLLGELSSGRLGPGQVIPSEHHLAGKLKIARNTVRQALSELERDGLIVRIRGKGTFVHEHARRRIRRGLDVFALVVPETRAAFYPSLLHGFETAAAGVRHQAIVCSTDNNVHQQADVILQLMDKEVGGVAIVPTTNPPTPGYQVRQLQQRGIPVVFCHRRVEGVQAPLLALPYQEVGRMAGEALAGQGHRRVAFLATHRSPGTLAYLQGLRQRMRKDGGDVPEALVHTGAAALPGPALQERAVREALARMLADPDPPTGIMTSFDSLAELVYLVLTGMGRRVPEDVSLVGIGGAWRRGAILQRLVSVTVDEVAVGRRAIEILHQMRDGQRDIENSEEILIPLARSQGCTLGPARPAPSGAECREPFLQEQGSTS